MKRCDCSRCKNYHPCESSTGYCDNFEPTYETNADRIRNMSDEELAKEIWRWHGVLFGTEYRFSSDIEKWLQSESEVEHEKN